MSEEDWNLKKWIKEIGKWIFLVSGMCSLVFNILVLMPVGKEAWISTYIEEMAPVQFLLIVTFVGIVLGAMKMIDRDCQPKITLIKDVDD